MNILIVDDHALFREALIMVLGPSEDRIVCGVRSLAAAMGKLVDPIPDVVLLDYHLPDASGLEALCALQQRLPDSSAIVILTAEEDAALARCLINAGARGFIPKSSPSGLFLAALDIVRHGGIYLPGEYRSDDEPGDLPSSLLTPRQREVLLMLANGSPNRDIAEALGVAESTIRAHVSAIFRILGVNNRTQAAKEAVRLGLVSPI